MSNPKVSVIIPVYNTEKFLKECLDSVLNQSIKEIEIICVDDGSTDSSIDILADYAKKDERVVVLRQHNQYAGVARNNGMEIAKGEYLSFIDSDDILEENMLERMYSYCKEYDLDVVVCRSDRFDDKTKEVEKLAYSIKVNLLPKEKVFSGQDIEKDFFYAFIGWPWDKLYKRDYIRNLNIKFQALRTNNDLYFVYLVVLMAKRLSYIDDILIHNRGNEDSSLTSTRERSWDNFYLALLEVRKFLLEHNLYERYERDFVNYCLRLSFFNLNTLKGESNCRLYDILRNKWYEELKVAGRSEEYFYDKANYARLCSILEEDLETHLINSLEGTKDKLRNAEKKLADVKKKLKDSDKKLKDTDVRLKTTEKKLTDTNKELKDTGVRLKAAEKKLTDTNKKLKDTENKLQKSLSREKDLKNSVSFRIGRAITWGPRKVRGGVRCYNQHGTAYTIRRLGWHITHLK